MADLLPLYARKVAPSDGPAPRGAFDVQLFRDADARQPAGRYPWWQGGRPDKRNRTVMLNCYRWRLIWLPSAQS